MLGDERREHLRRVASFGEEENLQDALALKNPSELLADRITRAAVPAVLLLAGATALGLPLFGTSWGESLLRAVTVWVPAVRTGLVQVCCQAVLLALATIEPTFFESTKTSIVPREVAFM